MHKVMTIFGTRPEAIKVAPVIAQLQASPLFESIAVSTGQHREMLDQVTSLFGIVPDLDLNIISPRQTLADVSARALQGVTEAIQRFRPDAVIVQGDTSTSTFAALAAFYERVPVVHLEAGLRTGDIYSPFPEEANRKITSQIAALHLAPTETSKANLIAEGVPADRIQVTGNTVIDALMQVSHSETGFEDPALAALDAPDRTGSVVLVTAHRRESLDGGMSQIADALAILAAAHPTLTIVFPIHKNPLVRDAIVPRLAGHSNIIVTEPLSYLEFTHAMSIADVVLTDSGGVQEEAPSLGKPVLVMRDTTERPEAVVAGTVRLIGTDRDRIVDEVSRLLTDPDAYSAMSQAVNPYGDGEASARTVAAIGALFDLCERLPEFSVSAR
jgi:UDP-N-acetylglucosamine 2-epimerase (non-hydrolysing)